MGLALTTTTILRNDSMRIYNTDFKTRFPTRTTVAVSIVYRVPDRARKLQKRHAGKKPSDPVICIHFAWKPDNFNQG